MIDLHTNDLKFELHSSLVVCVWEIPLLDGLDYRLYSKIFTKKTKQKTFWSP